MASISAKSFKIRSCKIISPTNFRHVWASSGRSKRVKWGISVDDKNRLLIGLKLNQRNSCYLPRKVELAIYWAWVSYDAMPWWRKRLSWLPFL